MKLILGNSLEKLKELENNSVDAVICDPPYELGFMGKKWDNTGIAYNVDLWAECLRVLKPGGHLLAFSGTRTYHRMAVAIEDAGFEIRDMLEWIYASGFPKSLNIGKAVDKLQGNEREVVGKTQSVQFQEKGYEYKGNAKGSGFANEKYWGFGNDVTKGNSPWEGFGTALKPAHESILCARKPLTYKQEIDIMVHIITQSLCQLLLNVKTAKKNLVLNPQEQKEVSNIAQWIVENNINTQEDLLEAMVMLQSELEQILNLNIVSLWRNTLEDLYKVMNISIILTEINLITELRTLKSILSVDTLQNTIKANDNKTNGVDINALTVAHIFTAELKKLNDTLTGFVKGVAISQDEQKDLHHKAHEPIVMARKPLEGKTIVENVLKHGTGGLDIDGTRIPTQGEKLDVGGRGKHNRGEGYGFEPMGDYEIPEGQGRFPANILVTDDALNDGVMTKSQGGKLKNNSQGTSVFGVGQFEKGKVFNMGDSGSKSRYFDIDVWGEKHGLLQFPKASKRERNEGCEGLENKKFTAGNYSQSPVCKTCDLTLNGTNDHSECSGEVYYREMESKNTGNNHPTVKSLAVMSWLVRLVSKEGDVVLDPFMGSGTTGVACKKLNRQFIGIEMTEEYIPIAEARIKATKKIVKQNTLI